MSMLLGRAGSGKVDFRLAVSGMGTTKDTEGNRRFRVNMFSFQLAFASAFHFS